MSMKMPIINQCSMLDCAYNTEMKCHALAITVGGPSPFCDTYFGIGEKGGDLDSVGGVGACKVTNCIYNSSLECATDTIRIGSHAERAECDTFQATM